MELAAMGGLIGDFVQGSRDPATPSKEKQDEAVRKGWRLQLRRPSFRR